ncbi:DUF736 family protein [Mesorhizobium japonicum]|nr:DUF736 family protein [Mesorhizobium japonicum]
MLAGATDFGAACKKTSREGRDYHSVKLDDPSLPAPIYARPGRPKLRASFRSSGLARAAE